MPPWNPAKAKVQLRISVQRLRMLQQKKEAQAKASRRDIATLVEKGKLETARVKVETIINEDIHVELLELLELYCELLIARFGILDMNSGEPDPAVSEGVCAIIYAAPRTELKELQILRDILMHKYGREYSASVMDNVDGRVSERVVRKLDVVMPSSELVEAYLAEIAKSYGVPWSKPGFDTGSGEDTTGGVKETTADALAASAATSEKESGGKESLDLPTIPPTEDGAAEHVTKPTRSEKPEDEFDALAKRFAALKKK